MKTLIRSTLALTTLLAFVPSPQPLRAQRSSPELVYLHQIHDDFIAHEADVRQIFTINQRIFARIDSLLNGEAADTADADLLRGIMNTRTYNLTIDAYRDILNGTYVSDPQVKLQVARHVAMFDGLARERVRWAEQWDQTARPYIYANGLLAHPSGSRTISDPAFRSILLDRRNFVRDVLTVTPGILASADSVLAVVDGAMKRDSAGK